MRSPLRYPTKLFTWIASCFFGFHAVFLIASGVLFYSTYTDLAYEEIASTKLELLRATSRELSNYISGIEDTAIFLVTNKAVRDTLSFKPESFYEYRTLSKSMHDQFLRMRSVKPGVESITLYTDWHEGYPSLEDEFLFPLSAAEEEGWLGGFAAADGFWIPEDGDGDVSYVHRIFGETANTLGVVKIDIPTAALFRALSAPMPAPAGGDYFVIMDAGGRFIASNVPAGLPIRIGVARAESGEELANAFRGGAGAIDEAHVEGRAYSALVSDSRNRYWRLVQLTPKDIFFKNLRQIQWMTAGLLLALFVVSIPLVIWISKKLTTPIRGIVEGMRALEKGDFSVRLPSSAVREYQYLTTQFNRMVGRLKELMRQVHKEHSDWREAELNLLQAQIKPHFLYNTLDMIHWRALDYEAHDISRMVHQLSRLFRIGLSNKKWYASLRDELLHADCYIAIQKYRQSYPIEYVVEAEKQLLDCLIPKIVLQPFLENAVIHGFKGRSSAASLRVSAGTVRRAGGDALLLTVSDDGCGLPDGFDPANVQGIGIRNVIERIQLYCGPEYGVDIRPAEGGAGTVVAIMLPFARSEEDIERLRRSVTNLEDHLAGG